MNNALREGAVADARAFGNQAYLGADVSGMDPAAANAFRLQALSNAGSGVGDAMTRYRAEQALREQEYARRLMEMQFGEESAQFGRHQDLAAASRLGRK